MAKWEQRVETGELESLSPESFFWKTSNSWNHRNGCSTEASLAGNSLRAKNGLMLFDVF
ncbi:hypothetical protein GALL_502500 [mine drainage metagenome]|uniref:Uncharacterized protein n=1 Tax=mine drainage metagenome TaxID=410659 RepID=A0A1J5PBQ1_9ZZZZ